MISCICVCDVDCWSPCIKLSLLPLPPHTIITTKEIRYKYGQTLNIHAFTRDPTIQYEISAIQSSLLPPSQLQSAMYNAFLSTTIIIKAKQPKARDDWTRMNFDNFVHFGVTHDRYLVILLQSQIIIRFFSSQPFC